MDLWAYRSGVKIDFSRPGKPTDNAFCESFNRTFRAECLDTNWFVSLSEVKQIIEAWRQDTMSVVLTGLWPIARRPSSPDRSRLAAICLNQKQAKD